MKAANVLADLRIPAHHDSLPMVRRLAATIAVDQHFSLDETEEFKIAVVEAVSNAITVCHQIWQRPCQVRILFTEAKNGISVDVASVLPKSRVAQAPAAELPGGENLELTLIRCLVDEMDYVQDAIRGVQLRMVKNVLG
jgi:anti-sigma regulatory factor (Ser/Thr protein kinase)